MQAIIQERVAVSAVKIIRAVFIAINKKIQNLAGGNGSSRLIEHIGQRISTKLIIGFEHSGNNSEADFVMRDFIFFSVSDYRKAYKN